MDEATSHSSYGDSYHGYYYSAGHSTYSYDTDSYSSTSNGSAAHRMLAGGSSDHHSSLENTIDKNIIYFYTALLGVSVVLDYIHRQAYNNRSTKCNCLSRTQVRCSFFTVSIWDCFF